MGQREADAASESPHDGAHLAAVLAERQSVLPCGVHADPGVIVLMMRVGARLARHVAALLTQVHLDHSHPCREYPRTNGGHRAV